MRRPLIVAPILLLLLLPLLPLLLPLPVSASSAAGAHVCAFPVQVAVGEAATITVGVGAEATAVTGVEIEIPDGFRLTDASGEGWRVETQDDVVRFDGASIAPFACGDVTLQGEAEEQAKLVFPLVMKTEAGEEVRYDSDDPYREDSGLLVYAGLELPALPEEADEGFDLLELAGWALAGVGVLLAGWLGIGWWRSRGSETAS